MPKLLYTALAASLCLCAPLSGAPLITEFMASNDSSLYDEDGDSSDWIEMHNPDATAADLTGLCLTDDPADLVKWRLPAVSLPAGGYLIVFASNKDRDVGELHTNFRLSPAAGGYLALIDADGTTLLSEFAAYPEQSEDFSYGHAQSGGTTTEVLVREGDACKILVPTADIGTTWQGLVFDDATWDDGTTGVGYEAGTGYANLLGGDVQAETEDINSTVYVRIPFSVTSKDGLANLLFRMKYDDGFIAYLNGAEIASGNKPANPTWNSDAAGDHGDNLAVNFVDTDITAEINGALLVGNNVLAIHGMNGDTGSSDLLALPRIEAEFIAAPGGLGDLGFFQDSSPGTANGSDQGLPSGAVTVSAPGRGFTGSLSVTLSTPSPAAQIRYTTNGNLPTASSTLYSGGNINITSSTLLRARAFEAGLTPGEVAEEGYIRLSAAGNSFSSDIPVVVMERFGSSGPTASNGKTFTFFAFFEPDPGTGRTTLNRPYNLGTRGGWKVRGSSSSGFAKKAFSIEAWDEDNGNKDVSPLGFPEESDFILNARSRFDRSLMRNAWIYELSNQTGRYAVRTKFVELFKDDNGGDLYSSSNDYAGVYTFMEKISRDKERVDVERLPASITTEPGISGGYMLKVDRLDPNDSGLRAGGQTLGWVYPKEEDTTNAQSDWIGDYLDAMATSLTESDYEEYIDVQSWVDHHLLNVLTQNADALRLSTYFHKKRGGKIEFGPIWDFDRSAHSTDGRDANATSWSGGTAYFTYPWWGSLFEDENFWQAYIDRFTELRDGSWATSNVHSIIDGMAAELSEAQVRNFQRWSDQPRFGGYTGEVNDLKSWLGTRLNWMDGQFAPRPTTNRTPGIYTAGTTVTLSAPLGGNQKIFYTLDGSDPRPPAERSTVVGTDLFDESQPVRAFVPGSDIGAAWRTDLGFDDGGWLSGTNGVGYERSAAGTYNSYIDIDVNTEMASSTSCYIRIKFDVAAADLATANFMSLQMRYDDGFVAYLNGTQIVADRQPTPLLWDSSATQTHDDGPAVIYQNFEANTFLNLLTPGENLLAIHALNESTTSSDFLNQSKLVIGFDENGGGGEVVAIEYTGPITLTETARLVARVFDSDGGHATNSGQTPVGTGWSAPLSAEYLVNETPAGPGDLAITEIMADPYSAPHPEWLEITNVSAGMVSLTDVSFTEGIGFTFGGVSLGAGESVVVTDDPTAFEQIYGTARSALIAGTFTGGLANAGETLTVVAANATEIQSVVFPEIEESGRTLVAEGAGWRASRSLLGSPGVPEPTTTELPDIFVNEILPFPSGGGAVDSVELFNPNASPVDISGWFLTTDLADPTMHSIAEVTIAEDGVVVLGSGLAGFDLPATGGEIYLIAAAPDGSRLDYVDGFAFGDASEGLTFNRRVSSVGDVFYPIFFESLGFPNDQPFAHRLMISEIMYNPLAGGVEFVEIANVSTSETIALAGVELSGVGFTFPPTALDLAPRELALLVEGDPEVFRADNSLPAELQIYAFPGSLDNGGETLRLGIPEPGEGAGAPDLLPTWDRVRYDDDAPWPLAPDGNGESLHRISNLIGSDPNHWESAAPTPGSYGEPIPDWRPLFFTPEEIADPTISGPLADPDGDLLANLLEYVLGSDPRDGSSTASLEIFSDEARIYIDAPVRSPLNGFDLEVEQSDDLEVWETSVEMILTEIEVGTPNNTRHYQAPAGSAGVHYRLRVVEFP